METLHKWGKPPPRTIIAEDFNAKHWLWQPGARPNTAGNQVADWAEATELLPILIEGPTNPHGNTIDLVFANTTAKARVDRTLDQGRTTTR